MVDDVSNAGQLREEDRLLVHVFSVWLPYSRPCPPQGESLFAFFPPCPCAPFILKRKKPRPENQFHLCPFIFLNSRR